MSQPESRLSRKIMAHLRKEGAFCFKVHGGASMTAGLPDIVGCWEGLFFGVETKMPGKETNVSPRQKLVHEEIRRADGVVIVATSPEDAEMQLLKLLAGDDDG